MIKMSQIGEYYFIPFYIYETESDAAFSLKQPVKRYFPIKVKLAYIDYEDMCFEVPIETAEAIHDIKDIYSDNISEPITTRSIIRVNRLYCFETFEEADGVCKQLRKDFALR